MKDSMDLDNIHDMLFTIERSEQATFIIRVIGGTSDSEAFDAAMERVEELMGTRYWRPDMTQYGGWEIRATFKPPKRVKSPPIIDVIDLIDMGDDDVRHPKE